MRVTDLVTYFIGIKKEQIYVTYAKRALVVVFYLQKVYLMCDFALIF